MRKLGILGIIALVGAGIVAATAINLNIGELGSLEEQEWLGIGA